ncbi:MAG TPA: TIGR03435 family protein [Bryobacteraceae bacterium]
MRCVAMAMLAFGVASAQPVAFDAASVRVNNNGPRYGSIQIAGHRLTIRATSLWMCIRWGWNLGSLPISGPDWLQTPPLYDIVATSAAPATPDRMRMMLRTLLSGRFGMKTRTEKREVPVMELVIGKGGSKMRPSSGRFDPSLGREAPMQFLGFDSDVHMQRTAGDRPGRLRDSYTNISMRELAAVMAVAAGKTPFDQLPVMDATGLSGRYDFALTIDLPAGNEHDHSASDDDPLANWRTVLQRDAGLTLEARKASVDVLVIDHINREPTAN